MKKSILKLTSMIMVLMLAIMLVIFSKPPLVKSAEITSENAIILQKNSGEKIIYISGKEATEFTYALSDNNNLDDAEFQSYIKDTNGKSVVYIESNKEYKYLLINENGNISTFEISNMDIITEQEVSTIENLTKKFNVSVEVTDAEVTNEDGTTTSISTGKMSINDDGIYKYDMIEIIDRNSSVSQIDKNALNLYNELNNLKSLQTTYEKLKSELLIRDYYNLLLKNANWHSADSNEVLQDEESEDGEVFAILLGKVESGKIVETDIQFMNCFRKDAEGKMYSTVEETKQVEIKTALPVTGENLALYIGLGAIIIAIIVLVIRAKKLSSKGKQNEQ